MKLTNWRFLSGLFLIVIIAIIFYFLRNGGVGNARGDTPEYKEYSVERGNFRVVVSASGVVMPIDRVEIKSKASGRMEELPVEEGDFIKQGALIARLDQTDVKAELEQAKADLDIAEAELKQAQNNYRRRQQLFEKGLISEEEQDEADLSLARAKGNMVRAQTTLERAQVLFDESIVRAPISGIILQKYVEEGQIIASGISNVSGGTPIVDIADMSSVYIEAGVDEIDVRRVNIGQPATVVAEAYHLSRFSGRIIRIAPEAKVEQNVTLFDVVIEVENREGKLKSGMNATVDITVVDERDVLLVPTMALSEPKGPQAARNLRRTFLKQGIKYVEHEIQIGRSNFRQTVVTSGLEEGDIVAVPMTSRLKAENERMEERIRSSRSFGSGN